jgi:hypothetical protein
MTNGLKVAIGVTLLAVVAIGGELAYLHHERNKPEVVKVPQREVIGDDDLVFLKHKRPDSMKDLKELVGSTLWVSAGGQMEYYPYAGHADYAKSAGTLLGAQKLIVKGTAEQVAPKTATYRIPGGDRQALLTFTLPDSADPAKVYAVPVGYHENGQYTFFTDDIFFYDDPHVLYKHWGPEVWKAVDAHQVILGMSEREVYLSLGQVSKSTDMQHVGDRMVVFANMGHPMAVTFVKNKVTAFRADQGF